MEDYRVFLILLLCTAASSEEITHDKCTIKLNINIQDGVCSNFSAIAFSNIECTDKNICGRPTQLVFLSSKPYSHLIVTGISPCS